LIRETTENESANEGYRFGQEEETYNIVAAHGYFGSLFFFFFLFFLCFFFFTSLCASLYLSILSFRNPLYPNLNSSLLRKEFLISVSVISESGGFEFLVRINQMVDRFSEIALPH
jgi:hypothetical protein